jgi:hypothetical protein
MARRRAPTPRRFRALAALALAALAAGCTQSPPDPFAGPDPADPKARTRPVEYRSTVAPYEPQRPVDPAPWREQNERVAPQPKQ